jgi:hypothetical protein
VILNGFPQNTPDLALLTTNDGSSRHFDRFFERRSQSRASSSAMLITKVKTFESARNVRSY